MNQDRPNQPGNASGAGISRSPGFQSSALGREPPAIPDHALLRCIGRGSYGEVWLARTVLGELRAVKIVHRSAFEEDRPFQREFEGLQKFAPISRSHPSQLAILHVGRNETEGAHLSFLQRRFAFRPPVPQG